MHRDSGQHTVFAKVVYWGPSQSGKTSNLAFLRSQASASILAGTVAIGQPGVETETYDCLPVTLGEHQGHKVHFDVYTVPGRDDLAAHRRIMLSDCDGIVFVADSRREAVDENISSMNELYELLRKHGISVPMVIQYNKQDLATALPPDQFNPLFNHHQHAWFAASATTGLGVMDTLRALAKTIMQETNVADLPTTGDPPGGGRGGGSRRHPGLRPLAAVLP